MEAWLKITLMLCVFGVLKETRPSEPFITKYLTNPPMNFTTDQVSNDIYPVSIYSMLAFTVVVFLLTDLVRYKPIIILLSLSGITVYLMLILCRSLLAMQILEVFYGLFTVCEVAYYTYIYAKVDPSHFQEVSGYTRAAYLVGRALSGVLAQVLVSSGVEYYSLQFVTVGALTASGIWGLFLPPVDKSIYFNPESMDPETARETSLPFSKKIAYGFHKLWIDFQSAASSIYIMKWVFWWALATCGYYQVLQYVQPLWEQILEEYPQKYGNLNGVSEASYTLISAAGSYGIGKLNADWTVFGESVLCLGSLAMALILLLMATTKSIIVGYIGHVLYAFVYNGMMTIANSEVARTINADSHGLIFGFTTFVALAMESVLTVVVIEMLKLPARNQFVVYGVYYAVLCSLFAVKGALSAWRYFRSKSSPETALNSCSDASVLAWRVSS